MPRASFFLRISTSQGDTIAGESEEHDFKGAIEVKSWDWSVFDKRSKDEAAKTNAASRGSRGNSAGAGETGKESYEAALLGFSKTTDRSTTRLLTAMLKRESFPSAMFTLRQQWTSGTGDGSEKDEEFLLHLMLQDVKVTKFTFNAHSENVGVDLDENWEFSYRTLQLDYKSAPGMYKKGPGLGEEFVHHPSSTASAAKKPEVTARDVQKQMTDMKAENERLRRSKS